MNRMARIGIDKPPKSHLEPTLDRGNPLLTLHGGSGGHYEVALLIAPKTVTPWAQTLLHRRVRFKIVECW